MLAIGRALVTNPTLLILDEATEGLAPLVREEIWRALATLRGAGHAMLVIDKYVQRLIAIGDRHSIVEKGRVVWRGSSRARRRSRALASLPRRLSGVDLNRLLSVRGQWFVVCGSWVVAGGSWLMASARGSWLVAPARGSRVEARLAGDRVGRCWLSPPRQRAVKHSPTVGP